MHNVSYRLHLLEKAEELLIPNIGAWNIHKDGREVLRVLVGGEENKVEKFINFVKESFPDKARVEGTPTVEGYGGDIPTIEAFSRSFSTSQLTKIANAGVGMLKMQEQALGKHDQTIGLQEQMLTKQDQTTESINKGFAETKQDFNRMDVKYDKVSEKMGSIDKTLQKLTAAILKLAESSKR